MKIDPHDRSLVTEACKTIMPLLKSAGNDAAMLICADGIEISDKDGIQYECDRNTKYAMDALEQMINENTEEQRLFRKSCSKLIEQLGIDEEAARKIFFAGLNGRKKESKL